MGDTGQFNIYNGTNDTNDKIDRYHSMWALGHTPLFGDMNIFEKALRVLGKKGIR